MAAAYHLAMERALTGSEILDTALNATINTSLGIDGYARQYP